MSKINDRLLASVNKFIVYTMYNDATICTFLESIMGSQELQYFILKIP